VSRTIVRDTHTPDFVKRGCKRLKTKGTSAEKDGKKTRGGQAGEKMEFAAGALRA
jgi:hypothetical protein